MKIGLGVVAVAMGCFLWVGCKGSSTTQCDGCLGGDDLAVEAQDMAHGHLVCSGSSRDDCTCTQMTSPGTDSTMVCGGDSNSFCCAGSTICTCTELKQWLCNEVSSGWCSCEWDTASHNATFPTPVAASTCKKSTPYTRCCTSTVLGDTSCDCDSYGTTCDSGATAVSSCASGTAAGVAAPAAPTCSSGQVPSCNDGTSSSPADMATTKLGIGEKCTAGSDCISGTCSNSGGGYCSKTCSVNEDCKGTPMINNSFGTLNYCVKKDATTNVCVPGCDYNNSQCATWYGAGFDCYPLSGVDFCFKP